MRWKRYAPEARHIQDLAMLDSVDWSSLARCTGDHLAGVCPLHHPRDYPKVAKHRGPKHRRDLGPHMDGDARVLCSCHRPDWCPRHHPVSYAQTSARHRTDRR